MTFLFLVKWKFKWLTYQLEHVNLNLDSIELIKVEHIHYPSNLIDRIYLVLEQLQIKFRPKFELNLFSIFEIYLWVWAISILIKIVIISAIIMYVLYYYLYTSTKKGDHVW